MISPGAQPWGRCRVCGALQIIVTRPGVGGDDTHWRVCRDPSCTEPAMLVRIVLVEDAA